MGFSRDVNLLSDHDRPLGLPIFRDISDTVHSDQHDRTATDRNHNSDGTGNSYHLQSGMGYRDIDKWDGMDGYITVRGSRPAEYHVANSPPSS